MIMYKYTFYTLHTWNKQAAALMFGIGCVLKLLFRIWYWFGWIMVLVDKVIKLKVIKFIIGIGIGCVLTTHLNETRNT